MSTSATVAIALGVRLSRERMERQFYLVAGCVFLIVVALGFQQFYLYGQNFMGRPVTHQIAPMIVVHGIGMSAWIIFLIVQSSLIVSGNRKLHMSLGVGGAVLAVFLVILGFFTAIRSAHYRPNSFAFYGGTPHFLIVPLTDIVGFGVLVALGLQYRRRPEIHRPMMCLATLFAIAAAFSRISFIRGPLGGALHGSVFAILTGWIPMLTLGLLLVLGKWLMTRTWDRYFAVGWAIMAGVCAMQLFVATTAAWSRITAFLTS